MIKENIKEFIKSAAAIEEVSEKNIDNVDILLNCLTDREERVIRLRYGLDDGKARTLLEVAAIFGVNKEEIREVESRAIKKMRHPSHLLLLEGNEKWWSLLSNPATRSQHSSTSLKRKLNYYIDIIQKA